MSISGAFFSFFFPAPVLCECLSFPPRGLGFLFFPATGCFCRLGVMPRGLGFLFFPATELCCYLVIVPRGLGFFHPHLVIPSEAEESRGNERGGLATVIPNAVKNPHLILLSIKKTPVCLVISKQGNVIKMEQVMRIELTTTAWEAVVLPLNYTCNFFAYYIKKRRLSQEKPRRFLYF